MYLLGFIGKLIDGRFKLRLVLGEGGMGSVYLAEDQKLSGRRTAVKIMSPRLTADPEFRARFPAILSSAYRVSSSAQNANVGLTGRMCIAAAAASSRAASLCTPCSR